MLSIHSTSHTRWQSNYLAGTASSRVEHLPRVSRAGIKGISHIEGEVATLDVRQIDMDEP